MSQRDSKFKRGLASAVNRSLGSVGLEVNRVHGRNDMRHALRWLRDNNVSVQTVLDVGASDGRWSEGCAEFFPAANYVMYEPQPVHQAPIRAMASRVPFNATVVSKAVGSAEGTTFFDATDPLGGALANESTAEAIAVDMTSIDLSVSEVGASGPFLLKLDTHGYERSILEGAVATLPQCSALVIESYNYRISAEAMLFYELCAYLADRGFRPINAVDVMHRAYDGSLWQFDLVFLPSDWSGFLHTEFD